MGFSEENEWTDVVASQLGFFRELNDLKRLYAHNLGSSSFATCVFRQACLAIETGKPLQSDIWCAAMIAGARLGAITPEILKDVGLDVLGRVEIFERSIAVHIELPKHLKQDLVAACPKLDQIFRQESTVSAGWVGQLALVPRAGATCPGKPRIALEPAEMHSDHCTMVALYGYLLADLFGADREDAWLIGLCHHFHNAYLPDAGFTGEMMLGDQLERIIVNLRSRIIHTLPKKIGDRIDVLFGEISDVTTPLAKAFHAADTIDRVIQMESYERAAQFRVRHALVDLNLVHEGTAQNFQNYLLKSIGLFPEPAG